MKKKNNTNSQKKPPQNNKKETPWPNLPKRLIKFIKNHPNTLETINFGLATKAWRRNISPHNSDQPQALLIVSDDGTDTSERLPQFFSIEFQLEYWSWSWYERRRRTTWPYDMQSPLTHILGCSHGLLFEVDSSSSSGQLYISNPRVKWCAYSPPLNAGPGRDAIPFRCAALSVYSNFYDSPCIMMVATGISSPAFLFYRMGSDQNRDWIKKDCAIAEPNSCFRRRRKYDEDSFMSFTNVIGYKGKFYALSSQGTLAVIEEVVRDGFEIVALGKTRAVPSIPVRGFRECLIESDGEILLVFLVHEKSLNTVDGVEVYRLRIKDLSWVRMESLGEERTLFVGDDCCVSVCAERVGCRGNRVYFTQRRGGGSDWWEFDMELASISRPDWAERANANGSGGNGNSLEWDKPISSMEVDHDS